MSEFLEMGGHAAYIWPCYIVAFVLLIAILVESITGLKKSRKDLQMMEALEAQENASDMERQAS